MSKWRVHNGGGGSDEVRHTTEVFHKRDLENNHFQNRSYGSNVKFKVNVSIREELLLTTSSDLIRSLTWMMFVSQLVHVLILHKSKQQFTQYKMIKNNQWKNIEDL